jgi:hypothetical protein
LTRYHTKNNKNNEEITYIIYEIIINSELDELFRDEKKRDKIPTLYVTTPSKAAFSFYLLSGLSIPSNLGCPKEVVGISLKFALFFILFHKPCHSFFC